MINERSYYNAKILHILKLIINKNPNMRFNQILWKLNIENGEDRFYEESRITYKKVINSLNNE